MTTKFSTEVEEAIADYLKKVELRLQRSTVPRTEVRTVLSELDSQIRTLLLEKGPTPTWNDLTEILSRMDSPEKFTDHGHKGPSASKVALTGLAIALLIGASIALLWQGKNKSTSENNETEIQEIQPPGQPTDGEVMTTQPAKPAIPDEQAVLDEPERVLNPTPIASELSTAEASVPVAIASFGSSANMRDAATVQLALTDGLINSLSTAKGIRVVERERISEALQDLRMSSEGMIDQATALQLGKLTGARVIITGNMLQIDDELVVTARLINTETSELLAARRKGARSDLLEIIDALGSDIASRITGDDRGVLDAAKDRSHERAEQQRRELLESVAGMELPRLLVLLPEYHLDRVVPDPAGETELVEWLLSSGFTVAAADYHGVNKPVRQSVWDSESDIRVERPGDNNPLRWVISSRTVRSLVQGGYASESDKLLEIADVMILGEGISERASERSGIVSCKGRLELKAIDIRTGEILLAKSTYGSGLDVAEHIAGKRALQSAGREMAVGLIPEVGRLWQERVKDHTMNDAKQ